MVTREIRTKGTYYGSIEQSAGQLTLAFDNFPKREVYWLVAGFETEKRFIGHKVVSKLLLDPETGLVELRYIDSADIHKLTDPSLRYALRFADAAAVVGFINDGPHVGVEATDQGLNSQLLHTYYVGVVDRKNDIFMENLRAAAPVHDL